MPTIVTTVFCSSRGDRIPTSITGHWIFLPLYVTIAKVGEQTLIAPFNVALFTLLWSGIHQYHIEILARLSNSFTRNSILATILKDKISTQVSPIYSLHVYENGINKEPSSIIYSFKTQEKGFYADGLFSQTDSLFSRILNLARYFPYTLLVSVFDLV